MAETKESILIHFNTVKMNPKKEAAITALAKLHEQVLYGEIISLIFEDARSRIKKKQDRANMLAEILSALSNCKTLDIPPSENLVKVIKEFIDNVENVPEWEKVKDILEECYNTLMSIKAEPKESDPFLQEAKELITHLQRQCILRLNIDYVDAEKLANRDPGYHYADEMENARIQCKNWPQYIQKCRNHIVLLEKIIKKEVTRLDAMENLLEISEDFLMIAKNKAYESGEFRGFRALMEDTSEKFQNLSESAKKKNCCRAFFRC